MALRDWLADAWFWLRSLFGKAPVTSPEAPQTPFRIILTRDTQTEAVTLGVLVCGDLHFQTLELPWLGNQHKVSCIPTGVYQLRLHPWDHEPQTQVYECLNVPNNRSPIDIHPGNSVKDTEGCILVGNHRATMNGAEAITDSRAAFHTMMGYLSPHPNIELEIV